MTVTTDLQTATGIRRRYLLKIEGHEPILWQDTGDGSVPTWSRSGVACLIPPAEISDELDIGDMSASSSAMDITLLDIKDSDGLSVFGKLFAPARWDSALHWRMTAGTGPQNFLDANADAVFFPSTTNVPASGTLYVGSETLNFSGKNSEAINGVSKGLYPALDLTNFGKTYQIPQNGSAEFSMLFCQHPFSFMGRMVALYITTFDNAANDWHAEDSEILLWAGRISDQIRQGNDGTWTLTCTSILDDLQRKIGTKFPSSTLYGYNMMGDTGRTFILEEWDQAGKKCAWKTCTVAQGFYINPYELGNAIALAMSVSSGAWTVAAGESCDLSFSIGADFPFAGESSMEIGGALQAMSWDSRVGVIKTDGTFCHVLAALGFDGWGSMRITIERVTDELRTYVRESLPNKPYIAYHPLKKLHNGSKLYVEPAEEDLFWPDQGDHTTARACVFIEGATEYSKGSDEQKVTAFYAYDAIVPAGMNANAYLNLINLLAWETTYSDGSFVGQEYGDEKVIVQQAYIPYYGSGASTKRGPFEMMLYPLLSTGTKNYNTLSGTSYDKLPLSLSLGISEILVDKASFLAADAEIMSSELAQRKGYVISEAIPYSELLGRECALFGYAPVWRNGKITIRSIAQPQVDGYDVTLDESNTSERKDWPDMDMAISTAINQYKIKVYNYKTKKALKPIIISDVDSITGLSQTKQAKIDHPGIYVRDKIQTATALLQGTTSPVAGRIFRFPSPVITRTMAPTLINKVFVGDIVLLSTDKIYSPTGTGAKSTIVYATVISTNWNHNTHTGECTLLLHAQYSGFGLPWAPSALVDMTYDTGDYTSGFDYKNLKLKLLTHQYGDSSLDDPHDGSCFFYRDKLKILLTHPTARDAFQEWAVIAAADYDAVNEELLIDTNVAATWDADAEYVVTYNDYTAVTAAQLLNGSWMANSDTLLLGEIDTARRYG